MIQDMDNVELFELCETCETNPKVQCPECLLHWKSRHRLLHLRTSLERESIQSKYPSMDIGSPLNPELCH